MVAHPQLEPIIDLPPDRFEIVKASEPPRSELLAIVEALVVAGEQPVERSLLESLPSLRHIACFTAGYDAVDLDWAKECGIYVTHAPATNHEDVADHAIGLVIASTKSLMRHDRLVRDAGWIAGAKILTRSLHGLRVGIVGMGRIGNAVANRADALRMDVAWWGPREKASRWARSVSLEELAAWSQVLIVSCRADETNSGLISAEVMDLLGPEALLVNVARGSLVAEDALIAALCSGRLGAASLDVFQSEPTPPERWKDVPNVILTPHVAGATDRSVVAMRALLVRNLDAVLTGQRPITPVPISR